MLQALQTLQPCKNTGQNGGVSTKRIMLTTGNCSSERWPSVHARSTRPEAKKVSRERPTANAQGLVAWRSHASLGLGCWSFFGASQLSRRYHAWTTTLRRRRPPSNPPATEQARKRNEAIMTRLCPIMSAYFVVMALRALIRIRFSN
jgi:hypothetical protein